MISPLPNNFKHQCLQLDSGCANLTDVCKICGHVAFHCCAFVVKTMRVPLAAFICLFVEAILRIRLAFMCFYFLYVRSFNNWKLRAFLLSALAFIEPHILSTTYSTLLLICISLYSAGHKATTLAATTQPHVCSLIHTFRLIIRLFASLSWHFVGRGLCSLQ